MSSTASVETPIREAESRRRLFERTYELAEGSFRIRPMEGLRGVAVILVFFVHFHGLFGHYARDNAALWWPSHFLGIVGNAGVDLFFLLSGYLIYGALIRRAVNLPRFLRRRIQRIYPPFLAVFAIYIVLSLVFPHASRIHGRSWLDTAIYISLNLLLLPGIFDIQPIITVAWSLSYEVFFYVSLAVLVRTTRTWTWHPVLRMAVAAGLWILYLGLCLTVATPHVRALMFVIGMLLYEALATERFVHFLSTRGEVLAIAGLIAAFIFAYAADSQLTVLFPVSAGSLAGENAAPRALIHLGPYKTLAFSISMFWCTAYCFAFDGRLSRWFCWTPIRYLGNMSYSYYLIHGVTLQGVSLIFGAIAWAAPASSWAFVVALALGFAATWFSSTVLFLVIEKPSAFRPEAGFRRATSQAN